jgi:hypothetical protein
VWPRLLLLLLWAAFWHGFLETIQNSHWIPSYDVRAVEWTGGRRLHANLPHHRDSIADATDDYLDVSAVSAGQGLVLLLRHPKDGLSSTGPQREVDSLGTWLDDDHGRKTS